MNKITDTNKKIQASQISYFDLMDKFPTDEAFIEYFIKLRYPDGVKCSKCGSDKIYRRTNKNLHCNNCHKSTSIFVGTIFERSRVSFRKWLYAIHMVINAKKSVSACQVSREIGGDYRTAWRMMHKIRQAMAKDNNTKELFKSIVEIDETYVGGKLHPQRHKGITDNKTPVVGAFDRDTSNIKACALIGTDERGIKLSQTKLLNFIDGAVDKTATHITDALGMYKGMQGRGRWKHEVINHSLEYVRGDIHTNNIENFWSLFKRGIVGQYHHVSDVYLPLYLSEFTWRFNNRKNKNAFWDFLMKTIL